MCSGIKVFFSETHLAQNTGKLMTSSSSQKTQAWVTDWFLNSRKKFDMFVNWTPTDRMSNIFYDVVT